MNKDFEYKVNYEKLDRAIKNVAKIFSQPFIYIDGDYGSPNFKNNYDVPLEVSLNPNVNF